MAAMKNERRYVPAHHKYSNGDPEDKTTHRIHIAPVLRREKQ
jgi:hypothetical protein